MMAVDLAVMGLQNWPISSIVLKVGIIEVLDYGLLEQTVFTSSSALFVGD
jgi:hypothetical protein